MLAKKSLKLGIINITRKSFTEHRTVIKRVMNETGNCEEI